MEAQMPNHIDNNVLIIATNELVKQIRDEIRGDEKDSHTDEVVCIDFDKIIAMPKELVGTSSPTKIISMEEYEKNQARIIEINEILEKQTTADEHAGIEYDKQLSEDELKKLRHELSWDCTGITIQMSSLWKKKFGADNWYDWKVENTGTKWDAYSCIGGDNSDNFFFFQTAWAHPYNLMVALSKKYPEAIFISTFADEDTGSNCGAFAYQNGESVFEDGSSRSNLDAFGTAFATAVQYGDEACENVEQMIEDECCTEEESVKIIEILKSESPLIKIARDLSEENAQFLIEQF